MKVMIENGGVPMLLVTLDFGVVQLATNQTLSVEDSVFWIGVEGILSGITDTEEVDES